MSLDELDDRLIFIRWISKKYQKKPDEIPNYIEELESKLNNIDNIESNILELEGHCKFCREHYLKYAEELSKSRSSVIKKLECDVLDHLKYVGLENACFVVSKVQKEEKNWSSCGIDDIDFLVSMNPGSKLSKIQGILSGGEMSRMSLVLKSILLSNYCMKTIIFDEIDAGTSGRIANAMGLEIKKLAQKFRVISITHNHQIAQMSDTHIKVSKSVANDRTTTTVKILSKTERIQEIKEMIGLDNKLLV